MEKLLDQFELRTYEQWKAAAESDLKGAPFEKKLYTQTADGLTFAPLYTQADIAELLFVDSLPGAYPYLRAGKAAGLADGGWQVAEQIRGCSAADWNKQVLRDLKKGLTALSLRVKRSTQDDGIPLESLSDLEDAVTGIDVLKLPLHLDAGSRAFGVAALLAAFARKSGIPLERLGGSLGFDLFSSLLLLGQVPCPLRMLSHELAQLYAFAEKEMPLMKLASINARAYLEAGASLPDELAFALAAAVETMKRLDEQGIAADKAAGKMFFQFAIGPNFFQELAKFRAARLLWAEILNYAGIKNGAPMIIHAYASRINKSNVAPQVNLLRETTEALSAVLGGCDMLLLAPFDQLSGTVTDFSIRLARNTEIILKEESRLHEVIDPAGGSWLVEKLTHEIAERTLAVFKEIEAQGGMIKALEKGFVQERILTVAGQRKKLISQRRRVLVGTSMYVNLSENAEAKEVAAAAAGPAEQPARDKRKLKSALAELTADFDFSTAVRAALLGATVTELIGARGKETPGEKIEKLHLFRESEPYEEFRSRADAYRQEQGKAPQVFFARIGSPAELKARSDFSFNFLEPGGFQCLADDVFSSPEAAASAAAASTAELVLLCSTDAAYPEIVPHFCRLLKEKNRAQPVVVAGYLQEHVEAFRAAGVDEFIHLRADHVATLQKLQELAGV